MIRRHGARLLFLILTATLVPAVTAHAGLIGTLANDSCIKYTASTGETVYFCYTDVQPTGTGIFEPFLRVQRDGTGGSATSSDTTLSTYSSGFNTDASKQDVNGFNDFDDSWTSALAVGDIAMINTVPTGAWGGGGTDFARFTVDINQKSAEGSNLLSLNQMVLYNCGTATYTTLSAPGCTSFFNLFGNSGDFINFDYTLNNGSGSGDVDVFIQNNAGFTGPYVALLDGWGCGSGSAVIPNAYKCTKPGIIGDNDGFQEWSMMTSNTGTGNPPGTVPEPASLLLLGSGLSAAGVLARRRRAKAQPPNS